MGNKNRSVTRGNSMTGISVRLVQGMMLGIEWMWQYDLLVFDLLIIRISIAWNMDAEDAKEFLGE